MTNSVAVGSCMAVLFILNLLLLVLLPELPRATPWARCRIPVPIIAYDHDARYVGHASTDC